MSEEEKTATTIPDNAAALVLGPDAELSVLLPNGLLDGPDEEEVPLHCAVVVALASMLNREGAIKKLMEDFEKENS